MANVRSRAEASGSLSTTAIIAIVSAIGVVILGLLAALVLLLIRAVRRHKQLLADLDERGFTITQAQKEAKLNEVVRPRAVLRRNTILPFNAKSGWGALPSVETIGSAAPSTSGHFTSAPEHYVPPMPIEPKKKTSRLSWPFHSRKLSGHTMKMKRLKANRLSAVLEDPKPSSLVPILGNGQINSRPALALLKGRGSQPSSCQSLLQYHPAFRNQDQDMDAIEPAPLEVSKRLQRAKSVIEVSFEPERPQMRQRSTSLHALSAGKAPDVILPPLPIDIARIKDEARIKNQLRHVPSKASISSLESTSTSILNPCASPIIMQSSSARAPKITKRERKVTTLEKMNPLIETRESMYSLHGSVKSSAAENEIATPEARREFIKGTTALPTESSTHTLNSVHTLGSVGSVKRAESITMSRVVSANTSPSRSRTPKRRSKTLVTSSGSPGKYSQITTNTKLTMKSPTRQTSRASSRSSCGNPFQWDPAPLTTTSRPPSALKGSPGARQGHRRGHSVRISLVPTVHSIRSRNQSPAFLGDDERLRDRTSSSRPNSLVAPNRRSLPAPPTSETFAPELNFTATTLRASLTPTSSSLPLVNYDQVSVVAPTDQVLPQLSHNEHNRLSTGSIFSISQFPLPMVLEPDDSTMIHISDHSLVLPIPDTPYLQQYLFRTGMYDREQSPSPTSLIDLDEYDPQHSGLGFHTPIHAPPRAYHSACTTIPEESSINSKSALNQSTPRYTDSPRTNSPPRFTLNEAQYNLPIHATTIPEEEESPRTIDPAVLTKHSTTSTSVSLLSGSAYSAASSRTSIALPTTPGLLDPLLNAAFSPSQAKSSPESPTLRSGTSSLYSSPTPTLSLSAVGLHAPCSPRPAHTSLPLPPPPSTSISLDFTALPNLAPSGPRGPRPRPSPPAPLRASIQQLRRMNSDASDARKERAGRGERRFLRLGRERSVQLPGEESWLDELEGYENENENEGGELDDEEVRRLVGTVLDEWEGEGEGEGEGDGDAAVCELEGWGETGGVVCAAEALGGARGVRGDELKGARGARDGSLGLGWDESDAFWSSATPPPPPPPPPHSVTAAAAAPAVPALKASTVSQSGTKARKRRFEVKRDGDGDGDGFKTPGWEQEQESPVLGCGKVSRRESCGGRKRRSVLGDGSKNVNVNVYGGVQGMGMLTPGSYYDEEGFLRV